MPVITSEFFEKACLAKLSLLNFRSKAREHWDSELALYLQSVLSLLFRYNKPRLAFPSRLITFQNFLLLDESPKKRKADESTNEEKKLAVMMMPRKKRKLYDKIMYSKKQKASEVCYIITFFLIHIEATHCKATNPFLGYTE